MSAAIFDITVYAFHNLAKLASEKLGNQSCYFYLPKIDFVEEAIFWNDILCHLESLLGAPSMSFKVTVIVESVIALS